MAVEAAYTPSMSYQGRVAGTEQMKTNTYEKSSQEEKVQTAEIQNTEMNKDSSTAASQKSLENTTDGSTVLNTGTEAMKKAVDEINKSAKNSEAIFGIHDATNRVTIKIVDKDTRKVLKEYPPEKTLDMIAKVWEMAGLMVDEKR